MIEREFLYKYRSLEGVNKKRVERIFTKNELYFPSPFQFNDPFDCKVGFSFEGSENEWETYTKKLITNYGPGLSSSDQLLFKKRLMSSEAQQNVVTEIRRDYNLNLGVFSLSQVPDDILMWSHYADSHQGICIGFFAGPTDTFFRISQEVKYRPNYPSTRIFDSDMERMEAAILTKSDQWDYEKEYRIIDFQEGPGVKVFSPELLATVILGCQISDKNRSDLINWIENHPGSPKLLEARKAKRKFALKLVKVP